MLAWLCGAIFGFIADIAVYTIKVMVKTVVNDCLTPC